VCSGLASGASSATGVTAVYGDNDSPFFWTATDLANKLREYHRYCNERRTHTGRDGDTPVESLGENVIALNGYRWKKY